MSARVLITVDGTSVECQRGETLLHVLQAANLPVQTACGGEGTCHLCRVQVESGAEGLPPPTAIERKALGNAPLAHGVRLACQVEIAAPFVISIPTRKSGRRRRQERSSGRGMP